MLDLTALTGELYQIKMADGTVLELKRPTQALYESILALGDSKVNMDTQKMMDVSYQLFAAILNRNTDGYTFDEKGLRDDYDFTIALTVLGDYMSYYAKEVAKRVDFQPAQ